MSALRELLAAFRISVDSTELKKGEHEVDNFVEKLKKAGEAFLAAFAVEKVHEFIDSQIEAASQLKVTAERLGIEAHELQSMQFAANLADVSSESLATSLRFLNRNIADAIDKGGEQAATFAKLGIHLKDAGGHTRTAGDIMGEFADAVAKIDDPAKQTQIAMQLLGRGGAELIPLLKQGSAAFDDARKQIEALGGGYSDEFLKKTEEAEHAQKKLTFATQGLKSEIATALLPVFEHLISGALRVVVNLRDMATHTDLLTHAFRAAAGIAIALAPGITTIATGAAILYLAFDELYTLLRGGDTILGDALGPNKAKFVTDLRDAIRDLTGDTKGLTDASDKATDSWSGFKKVLIFVEKLLAGIVKSASWVVRTVEQIKLLYDVGFGSGSESERAAQLFKARKEDLASGLGHENEDALKKTWAQEESLKQQANDIEKSKGAGGQALVDFAREYAEKYGAWEQGGKQGVEPRTSQTVLDYLSIHPELVVHAPGGAKGEKNAPIIHQTLNVHNELHPNSSTDEATAIGQLTDQTSKAVERANEHAYIAGNAP